MNQRAHSRRLAFPRFDFSFIGAARFRMRFACSCIVCDRINLHPSRRSFSPFIFRLSLLHPLPLYFVSSFPIYLFFQRRTLKDGLIRSDLYFSLSLRRSSLLFAPRTFGHSSERGSDFPLSSLPLSISLFLSGGSY